MGERYFRFRLTESLRSCIHSAQEQMGRMRTATTPVSLLKALTANSTVRPYMAASIALLGMGSCSE